MKAHLIPLDESPSGSGPFNTVPKPISEKHTAVEIVAETGTSCTPRQPHKTPPSPDTLKRNLITQVEGYCRNLAKTLSTFGQKSQSARLSEKATDVKRIIAALPTEIIGEELKYINGLTKTYNSTIFTTSNESANDRQTLKDNIINHLDALEKEHCLEKDSQKSHARRCCKSLSDIFSGFWR